VTLTGFKPTILASEQPQTHALDHVATGIGKELTWQTIFDKCSQIMAYADDFFVMGRRLQDVKAVFTLLVKQTNRMGLETNE